MFTLMPHTHTTSKLLRTFAHMCTCPTFTSTPTAQQVHSRAQLLPDLIDTADVLRLFLEQQHVWGWGDGGRARPLGNTQLPCPPSLIVPQLKMESLTPKPKHTLLLPHSQGHTHSHGGRPLHAGLPPRYAAPACAPPTPSIQSTPNVGYQHYDTPFLPPHIEPELPTIFQKAPYTLILVHEAHLHP